MTTFVPHTNISTPNEEHTILRLRRTQSVCNVLATLILGLIFLQTAAWGVPSQSVLVPPDAAASLNAWAASLPAPAIDLLRAYLPADHTAYDPLLVAFGVAILAAARCGMKADAMTNPQSPACWAKAYRKEG